MGDPAHGRDARAGARLCQCRDARAGARRGRACAGPQCGAPAGDRRLLAGDARYPLGLRLPDRRRRRDRSGAGRRDLARRRRLRHQLRRARADDAARIRSGARAARGDAACALSPHPDRGRLLGGDRAREGPRTRPGHGHGRALGGRARASAARTIWRTPRSRGASRAPIPRR